MIAAKTGNEAFAYAMKQINPDVVAAYPITPATEVVQIFASYVADGLVSTEYVAAESEHSAMSACIGAAAAGARVLTSTSSQGLALMHEMLFIAGGLRLPIVLCLVNRSLSSPLNIHCDHSDSIASRDSGWIQIFCESSQEAYDSIFQAVRIGETAYLPVMVTIDGFILSHCMERIDLLPDKDVQDFVGTLKPAYSLLNLKEPLTIGPATLTDYYFEFKRSQIEAMRNVQPIIEKVAKEFGDRFGRHYPIIEEYKTEDADVVALVMGSTAGTAKECVDALRAAGKKVGLVRLRVYRPMIYKDLERVLSKFKVVGVMDRVDSVSSYGGPLFTEVRAALYESLKKPITVSYIYGLGGREIDTDDITRVYNELLKIAETGSYDNLVSYVRVR
jgi:pyruvate ferredoxin oxidoreductase alpha subunit